MLTSFVIVFILFTVVFVIFVVPRATVEIATDVGISQKRWAYYCVVWNVFALLYLYYRLGSGRNREKARLLVLILVYLAIFFGAFAIDKYTDF